MAHARWTLIGLAMLALAGCTGLDLDPAPKREFPRVDNGLAAPPADLQMK